MTRHPLPVRLAAALLASLLLSACGGSEPDEEFPGTRQIEGPLYFTGNLTTLAAGGGTTDVPQCPPAAPDPIVFEPAGTVWGFEGNSVLTVFALQRDPDLLQFILSGGLTINGKTAGVTISIPDNVPYIDQAALGVNSGVLATPLEIPGDAFSVSLDLDSVCQVNNAGGTRAMLFTDLAGSSGDVLRISEITTVRDINGDVRLLEGTAFGGCVHAVLQNTYTDTVSSEEKNSQICFDACFRVRGGASGSALSAPATPCGSCAACP